MASVSQDIIDKYTALEKQGIFDEHIYPIIENSYMHVTGDFHYIEKNLFKRAVTAFNKLFILNPFIWYYNKFVLKTKVKGRENLKGVKKAILTCNHVFIYDCLSVLYSFRGKKLKIIGAEFNNKIGFFGKLMRDGGMLPLSSNLKAMINLNRASQTYLDKGRYILFYPEQAMWDLYEKPRPFKSGAFKFAAKFNVPVIPIFITFTNSGKYDKNGLEKKYFTVNIMKPVYPKTELDESGNTEYLKNTDYNMCKDKYEEYYGKKLQYDCN
jgi:1-acyl-sn-glycerol-3-phosphate acyltransferase